MSAPLVRHVSILKGAPRVDLRAIEAFLRDLQRVDLRVAFRPCHCIPTTRAPSLKMFEPTTDDVGVAVQPRSGFKLRYTGPGPLVRWTPIQEIVIKVASSPAQPCFTTFLIGSYVRDQSRDFRYSQKSLGPLPPKSTLYRDDEVIYQAEMVRGDPAKLRPEHC